MFSRIYFVVRSLFDLTHYQDNYARLYCTMNRTKPGFSFSIRCFMRTYPKVFILALIIPSFLVLGCFMRIYERPYTDVSGYNFQVYSNAVWASAVAMATVGFGDLVPSTSLGRFVGFTSAV